jgi:hypothetical protein
MSEKEEFDSRDRKEEWMTKLGWREIFLCFSFRLSPDKDDHITLYVKTFRCVKRRFGERKQHLGEIFGSHRMIRLDIPVTASSYTFLFSMV